MTIGFIGVNEILEAGLVKLIQSKDKTYEVVNCNLDLKTKEVDIYFIDLGSDIPFTTDIFNAIRTKNRNTKVLLYVSDVILSNISDYLVLGAEGVMTYECDFEEIWESIVAILKGGKSYCNKVLDILLQQQSLTLKEDCLPVQLSEREIEVVRHIASGKSSKQIAAELFLSYHTVNTHRKNVLKKVGVKRIPELVLFAQNMGLLEK